MKRKLKAGSTSQSVPIFVTDVTSPNGVGLGNLAYNTSGLVCEYRRQGQATWQTVTLAAGTLGTWSSGGFVADGTLAGRYEIGLPDAALASVAGVTWVQVWLYGAANMAPVAMEIELDQVNYQSSTAFVTGVDLNSTAFNAVAVTDPGAPANQTSLPKMVAGIWRALYGKRTLTATQLKFYAADGSTVNATQTVSDDGTTQTVGTAS